MNLAIRHVLVVILLLSLLSDLGETTLSKKDKKKRKDSAHDKTVDKKASSNSRTTIFTRGVRMQTYTYYKHTSLIMRVPSHEDFLS